MPEDAAEIEHSWDTAAARWYFEAHRRNMLLRRHIAEFRHSQSRARLIRLQYCNPSELTLRGSTTGEGQPAAVKCGGCVNADADDVDADEDEEERGQGRCGGSTVCGKEGGVCTFCLENEGFFAY